jgi:hypothetical protein
VLLASVVHGISCLFNSGLEFVWEVPLPLGLKVSE